MSKGKIEDKLDELRALSSQPISADTVIGLRKALGDRRNLVVAQAAKLAREMRLSSLIPDLVSTFGRLLETGAKTDSQCWAKLAIINTLKEMEYSSSPVFLQGLRHVQMEPVWGGQQDTATALRANCALALVQCDDLPRIGIFRHLVHAITDDSDQVRMDAARAIGQMQGDDAALLLRLKARSGDAKARVTGQVLESLLALEGDAAIGFVADFLECPDDEVCEEAALALGSSRRSDAIAILKDAWTRSRLGRRGEIFLRMLSASNHPDAIEFLLGLIREGPGGEAKAALRALELHADSSELQLRIKDALRAGDRAE